MTDVVLYPGEPNPNDLRLRDPSVVSGAQTFTYAGLIVGHSTISATVVGPPSVSRGLVPMRRVRVPKRERSWTRVELPRLYVEVGKIVVRRPRLLSAHRVVFSPPIQEGLIGARATLSGTVRYRDRVEEIVRQDDADLLELLLQ